MKISTIVATLQLITAASLPENSALSDSDIISEGIEY